MTSKTLTTIQAEARAAFDALDSHDKFNAGNNGILDKFLSLAHAAGKAEGLESVKDMGVLCGKLQEFPGKVFADGCGEPVRVMRAYACVDCSAPFHRKCLLKHFQHDMEVQSLTKMALEEALAKVDEMAARLPHTEEKN